MDGRWLPLLFRASRGPELNDGSNRAQLRRKHLTYA